MALLELRADSPVQAFRAKVRRRGYRSYLLRAALIPALLIVYTNVALFFPRNGRAEFYPFFSWILFPRTLEMKTNNVLFVRSINDQTFTQPRLYYDLGEHFEAARTRDPTFAKLLDNLVRAYHSNNAAMAAHFRQVIETTFLAGVERATYDVAVIRYRPLDRYRTGEILEITTIASGEKTR